MVTYDAIDLLFHFGMFLVTSITAFVAIVALVINSKEK